MKFRTFLLGLSALFVAFNAAFFSVHGLSKLFAGASLSVILMASSLEIAKLITAGYLYNYWEKINKVLRTYLVFGVFILILITSMGIYGFLTSAFQDTYNQFNIKEKQISFLQQKEEFWGGDVARYDEELKRISNNISTLSNARSQQIQVRDTSVVGGVRTTISTAELRLAQSRINVEEQNRKDIDLKVREDELHQRDLKEQRRKNRELKRLREEEEKEKEVEYIKIREWEEKFDKEQKLKEQEEMRREQRLIQKEMERRAKFDNINNTDSSLSQLEKFSIDKLKKN